MSRTKVKIMKSIFHLTFIRLFFVLLLPLGSHISMTAQEELSETRSLDAFHQLTATNGINVMLRKSSEERVDVRISNGLLSDVMTEVSNGTLKVKMRPQINKELSVLVVVYYKTLEEISITKGASLETKTVLLTERLKMSAKTGGSIKAEIECTDLNLTTSGGARVSLYGWAKRFEASANTRSKVLAKKFNADKALIRAATGAEIWVKPKDYLEAVANTGGTIFYVRTPEKKTIKESSGGEVRNKTVKIGNDLIRNIGE